MKSYGVTIQMKPRQQYFHTVLFIFQALLGVKGLTMLWLISKLKTMPPLVTVHTFWNLRLVREIRVSYKEVTYCYKGNKKIGGSHAFYRDN